MLHDEEHGAQPDGDRSKADSEGDLQWVLVERAMIWLGVVGIKTSFLFNLTLVLKIMPKNVEMAVSLSSLIIYLDGS